MRHPCLIEKRRTSCAPPSGSTIKGKCAVSAKPSGRYPLSASKQWFRCLHDLSCIAFFMPFVRSSDRCQNSSNLYRPIHVQTMVWSDVPVDPEGDVQDVHRFSMRHGCLIEKSRPSRRSLFRIGRGVFSLVTFFAPKKVTRAPARKRSQALPARHESSTPTALE